MATTSYCTREARGKAVAQGIVETTAIQILGLIRSISGEVHLTFEEGTQAAWLYDLAKPHVAKLVVCDPRKNKSKEDNKSDRIDAGRLSELLRLGSLTPVYHGEHGTRGLKELVRASRDLVRDVVHTKNRCHFMASLPIMAWQPFRVIEPSLRLRPNLNTGYCFAVVPVSSVPCPHPQLTGKSLWLYLSYRV